MEQQGQTPKTAELAALYEIPTLSPFQPIEELGVEIVEKATRLFGVRRLALVYGKGEQRQIIATCGFRSDAEIEVKVAQHTPNQFLYEFAPASAVSGFLFLEYAKPLGDRERRLYRVFAKRIEYVLTAVQIDTERRQAEEELRLHRERLEELVQDRTAELDARNKQLREEITEREQVTEALRLSEEKYRTLVEASIDAIFLETIDGEILDCNDAACEMLGYKRQELIGMSVDDLVPEEVAGRLPDVMEKELLDGQVFMEATNRKRTGEVFPVEISARLIEVEGRQLVVVYVRDITERKKAEEERWAMRQRIAEAKERELMERTNRLTSLGFLAAGVAHEVNNPLQGMLSHISSIKNKLPDDFPRAESVTMLENGVQTIAEVVKKLLILSREPQAVRETVDYREALGFVIQLLHHQFHRAGVDIVRKDEDRTFVLNMAQRDFTQVLVNLFINALDAMPSGGTLTVSARARGDWCEIELKDTGRGMSKRILSQIFTPFFTTKGPKGTGLGLSVTESLIRHTGGKVEVESEPGKGTRFLLQIPLARGRVR